MSSRSSTTSVALSGAFDSSGVPQQFDMRHLVRNVTLALGRLQLGITAAGKGNPPRHASSAASVTSAETESPANSGVSQDFIEAVLARIVVEVLQACRVQEPSATPVDTALKAVALTTQLSALHVSILRRLVQEDEVWLMVGVCVCGMGSLLVVSQWLFSSHFTIGLLNKHGLS